MEVQAVNQPADFSIHFDKESKANSGRGRQGSSSNTNLFVGDEEKIDVLGVCVILPRANISAEARSRTSVLDKETFLNVPGVGLMEIRSDRVLSQFELSGQRSEYTGLASYRMLDPKRPWFLIGVDGSWDIIAIKSASNSSDWDQKVGLLAVRHGSIDAEIDGWKDGAFMIRCDSDERLRIAPFVADLCSRVDPDEPVESALQIIDEWSDLWNRIRGPLSLEAQRGLIGELLCKILIKAKGTDSIRYWTGPTRAAQDFVAENWRVEVKTVGINLARPKISSLDQLLPSDHYSLHLILVAIRTGGDFSLNQLVDDVRSLCMNDEIFEDLLFQVGYYSKHTDHYTQKYSLIEKTYTEIKEKSEILHRNMLKRNLPAIESLQWILRSEELPFKQLPDDFWSTL